MRQVIGPVRIPTQRSGPEKVAIGKRTDSNQALRSSNPEDLHQMVSWRSGFLGSVIKHSSGLVCEMLISGKRKWS